MCSASAANIRTSASTVPPPLCESRGVFWAPHQFAQSFAHRLSRCPAALLPTRNYLPNGRWAEPENRLHHRSSPSSLSISISPPSNGLTPAPSLYFNRDTLVCHVVLLLSIHTQFPFSVKHSYSISVEPESGGESRRKKGETSARKRETRKRAATRDRTTHVQDWYGDRDELHELEAKKCDKAQEEEAPGRKAERKGKGLARLAKHAAVPFAIAATGLLERCHASSSVRGKGKVPNQVWPRH